MVQDPVQYCTVLYSTVQYCTVVYSTVQYCAVLYSTVQYYTVLYGTAQYCTVLDLGPCFGMNGHFRRDPDVSLSRVNMIVSDETIAFV